MLPTSVTLHDIRDVEGFVKSTLGRSRIRFDSDEREELVAEGIAILYELAASYEPHRPGYKQAGRFSGYAARFLPGRLGRAWHRRHREHRVVTDADGERSWEYGQAPASLDALAPGKADRLTQPRERWLPLQPAAVATARGPG